MQKNIIKTVDIKSMIYEIRGKQVMLDSNVAYLYGYETRVINQTVKRNIKRFPEQFCFQLTVKEYENLISQNVISSLKVDNYGGRRKLPNVFTEQGIAMLSGLLKNDIAIDISISIMKAFVEMRKFIMNNALVFERLSAVEYKLLEYDNNFDIIFNELEKEENIKQKIFFDGQIYDAYSLVIDIIKKAKKEIIVIDNYIDKTVLDILSNKNKDVNVKIIGRNSLKLKNLDISKFNEQYPMMELEYNDRYHDRFIIIDREIIYHLGSSLKDLGKKTFAINKMEDNTFFRKNFLKKLIFFLFNVAFILILFIIKN